MKIAEIIVSLWKNLFCIKESVLAEMLATLQRRTNGFELLSPLGISPKDDKLGLFFFTARVITWPCYGKT